MQRFSLVWTPKGDIVNTVVEYVINCI